MLCGECISATEKWDMRRKVAIVVIGGLLLHRRFNQGDVWMVNLYKLFVEECYSLHFASWKRSRVRAMRENREFDKIHKVAK